MHIRTIRHRGLRRFVEYNDSSGLPNGSVEKLRRMITFLEVMLDEQELYALAAWKAHQLSGARAGTWSLSVTRNWRLTFLIDQSDIEIIDLNFEDYH